MQQTLRSYLTAGVAVVGAGAVALAPIQPVDLTLRDTRIPAVFAGPVGLTAMSNPSYEEVFTRASANLEALIQYFFDQYDRDSTPIQVVFQNQTANLETIAEAARNTVDAVGTAVTETVPAQIRAAFEALGDGDFYSAVNLLVGAAIAPVAPLLFLAQPIQAAITSTLSNAVKALTLVTDPLVLGLQLLSVVGPIINGAAAAVASVQAIVDSFDGGDPLQEIVNAPAAILNGFLNGGYGPDFGALLGELPFGVFAGGLLTGPDLVTPGAGPVPGLSLAGPLGMFLNWREQLATSFWSGLGLGRVSAKSQVSDVPDLNANFVSVYTDDEPADEPKVDEVSFQKSPPLPEKIVAPVTDDSDEGTDVESEPTDSEPVDGAVEGDDSDLEESVDVSGDVATEENPGEDDGPGANDGGSDNGGDASGDDTSGNGSNGSDSDSSSGSDKGSDGSDE